MAQLTFEQIINLTEDSGNTEPLLTQKLMIGNEPNNELYQYYIHEALTRDKEADIILSSYTPLQWGTPARHLTGFAVSNIGIKTFPQIGAYGFYTRLGDSSSKMLLPIHLRRSVYYTAPTISMVESTTHLTFTFTNPADISYDCFRLVMQRGRFADEYISYASILTVPKSDLNGTYVCYAIGYVGEGRYTSEESNTIDLTIVNPYPPTPVQDKYIQSLAFSDDGYLNGLYTDGASIRSDNPVPGSSNTPPYVRFTAASQIAGSTTLTASISCEVDDLVLAVATTRYALTVPTGWTLLYTSPSISSDISTQYLHVLYKRAESNSETITIVQASADRIYLNLHDIPFSGTPVMLSDKYQTGTDPYTNPVTVNKATWDLTIWAAHMVLWATSGTNLWQCQPQLSLVQVTSGMSPLQPRLVTILDNVSPIDHTITTTSGIADALYELCAIHIPSVTGNLLLTSEGDTLVTSNNKYIIIEEEY